jgi:hypothetical protein
MAQHKAPTRFNRLISYLFERELGQQPIETILVSKLKEEFHNKIYF